MRARKAYITVCAASALLLGLGRGLFAGALTYSQAAAPWNAGQAAQFAPQITSDFLRQVEAEHGRAAAAALAEKAKKVPGLLDRLGSCSLKRGDAAAAERFFTTEFRAEAGNFAAGACAAGPERVDTADPVTVPLTVSAAALEAVSVSGALETREGGARFFDGSSASSAAPPAVYASAPSPAAAARYEGLARPIPAPRFSGAAGSGSRVPAVPAETAAPAPPPGPFNRAAAYLRDMRRDNWVAFRSGDLTVGKKAGALARAAAGATAGFVLWYTNLAAVETAAARLRRDRAAGADPRVIRADAAKLAFHIGLAMIAPIPIANITAAVAAGRLWGYLVVGYVGVAIANRFYHFAD